jgi:hypothetical protein
VRLPSGSYPERLIAALLLGAITLAGCSGDRGRPTVKFTSSNVDQTVTSGEQPKRPVHSLGPEMRRTKGPPKR